MMKKDIYFDKNYGKLYEKAEEGESISWIYEGEEGRVSHLFIKREIPISVNESPWFDIVSPYGYGGPIIENLAEGVQKDELVKAFEKSFANYCEEQRIVSEFVRFHPIVDNAKDFETIYNAECIRHTIGTNLKEYDEPVQSEFSKSCRKRIRRALRDGISFRVTEKPENIEVFKEIYYSTMDRNNASEYYYFDDVYFQNCINYFKEHLILVEAVFEEKTIAAGLYFVWDKVIHIHLSGTLSEYLYLSPAYILRYAVTLWGKEHGYELIHHGGGRSNSEEDTLYTFKKQFGENTEFQFYVGRKIWNSEIYKELCKGIDDGGDFFPLYRKR